MKSFFSISDKIIFGMFSILSKGLLVYLFVGYLQVDGKRSQLVNLHKIFCYLPYTYINWYSKSYIQFFFSEEVYREILLSSR